VVEIGREIVDAAQISEPKPRTMYGPNRSTIEPTTDNPAIYDQFHPERMYPMVFGLKPYCAISVGATTLKAIRIMYEKN